jgi:FixJ family two-component response regulator
LFAHSEQLLLGHQGIPKEYAKMSLLDVNFAYRPYHNRHRVVYILHAAIGESEDIAAAFSEQGFMASTAQTVEALARLIELHRPDVILVDLAAARQQADLIATLRSVAFGVRVFILADNNPDALDVVKAVRSGAVSIFVKPFQLTEMTRVVGEELRADLRPGTDDSPVVQGMSSLTPRELDVLRHVIAGETNKETALALGISPRTVEVHRAAVMRKLGARNAAEMIRMVLKG